MTANPKHDFKRCAPGAFAGGLTHTLFFDGMVLSAADMQREHNYWRMKRKLTNRALGEGVVWGLSLHWDAKTRCFTLCPGYGLSCCGDDLIVECVETICEGDLIDPCSKAFRQLMANPCDPCDDETKREVEACLLLEYVECPENPREHFDDPCAQPVSCRYGALRETTRLCLVPPPKPDPTGPIEWFCKKLHELREKMKEPGIELPPAPFETKPVAAHVAVEFLAANGDLLDEVEAKSPTAEGDVVEIATTKGAGFATARIKLAPTRGSFFASAKVDGQTVAGEASFMGYGFDSVAGHPSQVELEMAQLFGDGDIAWGSYRFAAESNDGTARVRVELAEPMKWRTRPCDCNSLLAHWLFFNGDPKCILPTLAIAVSCGWFAGMLGAPPCCDKPDQDHAAAKAALALWVCAAAWEAFFGIKVTPDNAHIVHRCLHRLFEAWCHAMHYKGPYCDTNQHGIILGCVRISPKGRITCFDPWSHRRHVLTGPLINHWIGLFGLAPVDVMAARVAGWICCVSGVEPSSEEVREIMAAMSVPDSAPDPIRYLYGGLAGAFGSASFKSAAMEEVVGGLNKRELLMREVSINRDETPVLARAPIEDLVLAVSEALPVASIKFAADAELVRPVLAALEAENLVMAGDLVHAGSESVIGRVKARLADDPTFDRPATIEKTVGQVYAAAVKTMASAAEAVIAEAKTRGEDDPFMRSDLTERKTLTALRRELNKNLESNLSAENVRVIAAKAAASG